jgi:hypothetical protein
MRGEKRMQKKWSQDGDAFPIDNIEIEAPRDTSEKFGVTLQTSSETLKYLKEKEKKGRTRKALSSLKAPLQALDIVRRKFIINHIRTIHYRDIARLLGMKANDLKVIVEKMGIKLPIERAKPWADINVGKFHSLEECARCQVQRKHSTFLVGINNCRKCCEQNIVFWIENGDVIQIEFDED